jgi:hypothetical protein
VLAPRNRARTYESTMLITSPIVSYSDKDSGKDSVAEREPVHSQHLRSYLSHALVEFLHCVTGAAEVHTIGVVWHH